MARCQSSRHRCRQYDSRCFAPSLHTRTSRVANANNRVRVTVEGPGRLVGPDNGDSTDYDSYKGESRRLFSGKPLAVVASAAEAGDVVVRAVSPGLRSGELGLTSVPPLPANGGDDEITLYGIGSAAPLETGPNTMEVQAADIPVRKLEILCPEGNRPHPDQRSIPIRVRLHPADAAYPDVQWRITNAAGVDANIATLQTNGHEAVVTALGDGNVYIRCATNNGSDKIKLYAQMELQIAGLGQAHLNPYEFVSAGYHSEASRNLTNGNERGVATARDEESRIVFEKVDFGSYGADEIALPVFSLDGEAFPIEIWEGIPGEQGAERLSTVTYQKPSRWNVYQEATYRLPRRLQGITSLSFVLRRKIHLKGFQFNMAEKAYARLSALENDRIYGDSFTLADEAVENIGNNVSLVFEDMDFGERGSAKLVLCGHSPSANNTLHLLFSGPEGESKQIVEFAYSDGYREREFDLERIAGAQTVTFVFLPGSHFHLKWFQFR
uniref:hypothetical protein n=1 Tax=Cohnella nanjingensis TaxID=1387779 RepID=UPI001FEAC477|nr:hypothetical protein [Cohnella nanjingensis]